MTDYEAIRETVLDYFEDYLRKDRARLEITFEAGIANMMGHWKLEDGTYALFSTPTKELTVMVHCKPPRNAGIIWTRFPLRKHFAADERRQASMSIENTELIKPSRSEGSLFL